MQAQTQDYGPEPRPGRTLLNRERLRRDPLPRDCIPVEFETWAEEFCLYYSASGIEKGVPVRTTGMLLLVSGQSSGPCCQSRGSGNDRGLKHGGTAGQRHSTSILEKEFIHHYPMFHVPPEAQPTQGS